MTNDGTGFSPGALSATGMWPPLVLNVKHAPQLPPPPELNNPPPVPFRRTALRQNFELPRSLSFSRDFQPHLLARLSLAVERLRHRCRTSLITQAQYLDFKIAAIIRYLQRVANSHFASSLSHLSIRHNPPQVTCLFRKRPRLEESRCPQPGIDPQTVHSAIPLSLAIRPIPKSRHRL